MKANQMEAQMTLPDPVFNSLVKSVPKTWSPEEIRIYLYFVVGQGPDTKDRIIVYKMLQAMYDRQTHCEQHSGYTVENNGIGFTAFDAPLLSDIAFKSKKYKSLTPQQAKLVAKKLIKYSGQLSSIAKQNLIAEVTETTVSPETPKEEPKIEKIETPANVILVRPDGADGIETTLELAKLHCAEFRGWTWRTLA